MSPFHPSAILLALTLVAPRLAVAGGVVEGRVALPEGKTTPVMTKRYEIVSSGGVLSPNPPVAVVSLEGKFPDSGPPEVRQVVQTNFTFIPALLPVRVGTKVEFPNQDATYHNIFSLSPPKRFDLGRYTAAERPIPSQVFDRPGLVTLRCDIHEHMRALVLVLDTPHFVTTDPSGTFRLTNLPPGRFTLKAWVNSRTTLSKEVEVTEGGTTRVELP